MATPIAQSVRIAPTSTQSIWKYNRRSNISRSSFYVLRPTLCLKRHCALPVVTGTVLATTMRSSRGGGGGVCGLSGEGNGLPSSFAKNVSIACFAIGAALDPMLRVLDEDGARNPRVVARRKEDEPAVIPQIPLRPTGGRPCTFSRYDLRRSRLARDVVSRNPRPSAGAGAVDDEPQAVPDRLEIVRIQRHRRLRGRRRDRLPPVAIVDRFQQGAASRACRRWPASPSSRPSDAGVTDT